MNKSILLVIVLFFLLGNIGCANVRNPKNNENTINSNIPYSIRMNMSIAIKKNYVEEKLGKADIIRIKDNKTYEIRKKNDGSLVFITYDNENGILLDVWRLKKIYVRSDFGKILEGEVTLDDVVLIDPYTKVVEYSEDKGISEHRLINNEIVVIKYMMVQGKWIVENISFEKDQLKFSELIGSDSNIIIGGI